MSVEIINLAATQAPRSGRKADAGASSDGASFDAALTLRRAAGAGKNNAEGAAAAGLKPIVSGAPGKDDGESAQPGLRLVTASQLLQLAERLHHGAASGEPAQADTKAAAPGDPTAQADVQAADPRLLVPGSEPRLEQGAQTTVEPLPETASEADIASLVDGLVDDRVARPAAAEQLPAQAAQTAPAQNTLAEHAALSGNAGTAAVAALQQAAPRAAGEATNDKAVPATRGRLHAQGGAALTASRGAAAASEQIARAALDGDAPRAASERETFLLARNMTAPAGTLPEGRAQPGAGEPASFLTALNAHAPSAQTAPGISAAAASAPIFSAPLNAPVGSEAWNQAINQQSLRLSHFGDGSAELTLHPRELGQIQVSLKMGEQAQLHFASPNAQVRAAVEAALPQLRQAFADSGIDLGQASVSDQGSGQSSNPDGQPQSRGRGAWAQPLDDAPLTPLNITTITGRTLDGGIDIFA